MTFSPLRGHHEQMEAFRLAAAQGRLASTFLFVGPSGIGKRTFALQLAQALLCESSSEQQLDACGHCSACLMTAAQTHPDLMLLAKPADKRDIPVEMIVGERGKRRQEGLCHWIGMRPFRGCRKIAVIDDADFLNQEGANSLLKTLEEPPSGSLIILIGTNEQRQLPTIRSRCQIVRFDPLSIEDVAELLVLHNLAEDSEQAQQWAERSGGSITAALQFADDDIWTMRDVLWRSLHPMRMVSYELADTISAFIEAAGKETSAKRTRMRCVLQFAIDYHRAVVRALADGDTTIEADLVEIARSAAADWPSTIEAANTCILRSLQALAEVDSNANLATLIACWCDDIEGLQQGQSRTLSLW